MEIREGIGMSTKIKIDIELTIAGVTEEMEVEVEGTIIPEVSERGPSYSSGGEPGEDAYIEDLCVGFKGIESGKIVWNDLTNFLTVKQIKAIEEKLFDAEISGRECPTYERY